jgi:protein-S-isoprenylcysteine O-methyltransferase Ste14
MTATRLGVLSFLFGVVFDLASIKNIPRLKPAMMIGLSAGQALSTFRLISRSPRFPVPRPVQRLCMVLAPLSLLAMFYSIFVEVPLRKAWLEEGHTDDLVTDGTYALTRHPGVLWYGLWLLTAALASRSARLLRSAPFLALGDAAYVVFQERFVLVPYFGEAYREYQRTTPMLIPNGASIRRFLAGLRGERAPGEAPPADAPTE